MTTRPIVVPIDGEPVRLHVGPYTVRTSQQLAALGPPPGPGAMLSREQTHATINTVGPLVSVAPGDVLFDGVPLTTGTELLLRFAGRQDVLEAVRRAAITAQSVTEDGPRPTLLDLRVAVRFTSWLSDQRRGSAAEWVQTGASCGACLARGLSTARNCDGTAPKGIVWNDGGDLVLRACPVRSLLPEVDGLLQLFRLTHAVTFAPSGLPQHARVELPGAGGVLDQDAWTMEALDTVCLTANDRLVREFRRQQEEQAAHA
jgi:hypothetical protein